MGQLRTGSNGTQNCRQVTSKTQEPDERVTHSKFTGSDVLVE